MHIILSFRPAQLEIQQSIAHAHFIEEMAIFTSAVIHIIGRICVWRSRRIFFRTPFPREENLYNN